MDTCKDCFYYNICLESEKDLTCKYFKDWRRYVKQPIYQTELVDGNFIATHHKGWLFYVQNREIGVFFPVYAYSLEDAIRRAKDIMKGCE